MRRLYARLAAISALAVATAVFTGGALAGGGGNGNSENAPGQQKQAQAPAAPQASHSSTKTKGVNSTQQGTKPSAKSSHNTSTHVGDSPDVSKRYGNGKTAGQIAKSRGAKDDVEIKGPGNSQPHKVCRNGHWVDVHAVKAFSDTTCAPAQTAKPNTPNTPSVTPNVTPADHKVTLCHATGSSTNPFVMITVDYHSLKEGHTADKGDIIPPTTIDGVTYSANWDAAGQAIFGNGCKPAAAAAAQAPVVAQQAPGTTTAAAQATATVTTTAAANATVTTTSQVTPAATTANAGGVLGAQTTLAKPKSKSHGGVLGTVTHVAGSTLPFTGFPVWLALLIAVSLILAGIALRRRTLGARL